MPTENTSKYPGLPTNGCHMLSPHVTTLQASSRQAKSRKPYLCDGSVPRFFLDGAGRNNTWGWETFRGNGEKGGVYLGVSENSVPLNPMVLLIIIPIKWLFHWEY